MRANKNSRGPPTWNENKPKSNEQVRFNDEQPEERVIRKARRRHDEKMQLDVSDEEFGTRKPAESSYIYAANNCSVKKYPLFRVKALFNGLETEAILDTGASITLIPEKFLEPLDISVDSSTTTELIMANNCKVDAVGTTEPITIEVNESSTVIKALVMPVKHSQILLGMDWFNTSGAMICPKENSLRFMKAKPRISEAKVAELENTALQDIINKEATRNYLEILEDIGSGPVEVYSVKHDAKQTAKSSQMAKEKEQKADRDVQTTSVLQEFNKSSKVDETKLSQTKQTYKANVPKRSSSTSIWHIALLAILVTVLNGIAGVAATQVSIMVIANTTKAFTASQTCAAIQLCFISKNEMIWTHSIQSFEVWQTLNTKTYSNN
jgi:predicted aspartyl protease